MMLDLIMNDKRIREAFAGFFAGTLDAPGVMGLTALYYPDVSLATFVDLYDYYEGEFGE